MGLSELPEGADPTPEASAALVRGARKMGLSGRGVHRVLRLARTIADLLGRPQVELVDVAEALAYRS